MKEIPLYMVFVLYLIISSNFLAQVFSCRLQYLLNNSMIAKHVIGYMTFLFFVILSSGNKYSTNEALWYSLLIYLLFWISTRMSLSYFITFITLTAILYILHLYEKEFIYPEKLVLIRSILQLFLLILLFTGFIFYYIEKQLEYKNKFCFTTFMLGKPKCLKKSPTITGKDVVDFFTKKFVVSTKK